MDIYIVYIYIRYIVSTHSAHTQIHTNTHTKYPHKAHVWTNGPRVGRSERGINGRTERWIYKNK